MGCGALDYRQQAQQMELRTGGMSVSTQVTPDSTQLDMYEQVSASSVYLCLKQRTKAKQVKRVSLISIPSASVITYLCPAATHTHPNQKFVNVQTYPSVHLAP